MSFASPVTVPLTVLVAEPDLAVATVSLPVGDPVFTGHYPGFPVLPGVYVVELVDSTSRAAWPGTRLELRELIGCRFRGPITPGDRLTVRAERVRDADTVAVRAEVSTERGVAASVRLSYVESPS